MSDYNSYANSEHEMGLSLLRAADNNNLDLVRALISAGVPVDFQDQYQDTALMYAADRGHLELVKYLIRNGANIDHIRAMGHTPLMRAIMYNHFQVVRYLIEAGANLDIRDFNGETALMLASAFNSPEIFKELLKHGATIDIRDEHGIPVNYRVEWFSKFMSSEEVFNKYRLFKELYDLRNTSNNYLSVIPHDLIYLIEIQLENDFLQIN